MASVTTTFVISSRLGISNIKSIITDSIILLKPRAPVRRSIALAAIAWSAAGSNSNSTLSMAKSFWYCFTNAFFGFVKISTKSSLLNGSNAAVIGRRPINSGISPNFCKSSGIINCIKLSWLDKFLFEDPNPMIFAPRRSFTIVSIPSNAPPTINRIFVVSIWMSSWCGCLRPPWGGTDATVPSKIFSKACWTPSPLTSRVMDTFSLLRAILSISSM